MSSRRLKRYPERDSPFFRLKSKNKLARILQVRLKSLKNLANSAGRYREFRRPKSNGGVRIISAPQENLKRVQRRIADLLQRVELPNSVYSPVRGRSYVDNALAHLGANSHLQLDISDYFTNCKEGKVIWYFKHHMECSPDVANLICGIVTHKGSLPQGSPCSPILAYLSYQDMWKEIESVAIKSGCRLSTYIDDITISGERIPRGLSWDVRRIIRRHGHICNPTKARNRFRKATEVTGVIIRGDQATVPNRQLKRIYELRRELMGSQSTVEELQILRELNGRESQIQHIRSVLEKLERERLR